MRMHILPVTDTAQASVAALGRTCRKRRSLLLPLLESGALGSALPEPQSGVGEPPGAAVSQHRAGLWSLPRTREGPGCAPSGLLGAAGRAAHALCMTLADPTWPPSRSRPFRGPACCQHAIPSPRGTEACCQLLWASLCAPQGAPGALLGLIAWPRRAQPLEAGSSVAPEHAGWRMARSTAASASQVGPRTSQARRLRRRGPWSRAQRQQGTKSSHTPPLAAPSCAHKFS